MKKCSRCGEEKSLDNFGKNKRIADGLHYWCKSCCSAHKKSHYKKNKEEISVKARAYYEINGEKIRERVKQRYWDEPSKRRDEARKYQRDNRISVYKKQSEWAKQQRKENPQFAIRKNINRRLGRWVKGTGSFKMLMAGCDEQKFIRHIEDNFVGNMSWQNYGTDWTFDHIIPLTAFDLTDEIQAEQACHFSNIQPLTFADNAKKGGANRMK